MKTIFSAFPINRQSPTSFVWTTPTNGKHQTSTVQAIATNNQRVKTIFRTIPIDKKSPRSLAWIIPITWKRTSIIQAILIKGQARKSIIWTSPMNTEIPKPRTILIVRKYQTSIIPTIPINRQSLKTIVQKKSKY